MICRSRRVNPLVSAMRRVLVPDVVAAKKPAVLKK
jgi:hypothetical protein